MKEMNDHISDQYIPVDESFGVFHESDFLVNQEPVKVYAFINEENHIVDLKSSIFYTASDDDIIIAEGFGDNFVHIGEFINNELKKPLFDKNMCANFKVSDGPMQLQANGGPISSKIVSERTEEEKQQELQKRPKPEPVPTVQSLDKVTKELREETNVLTEAVFDVDAKVIEQGADVELTMAAIFEIDEKANQASESVKDHTIDIEAVTEAVFEMDSRVIQTETNYTQIQESIQEINKKLEFILKHLSLTYPPTEHVGN